MVVRKGDAPHLAQVLPDCFQYESYWSSPEAFARYIATLNPKSAWLDSGWEKGDFYGSGSMGETLGMAKSGWPEGAERVSRIRDYVNASNPIRKLSVRYDIAGTTPCVPRAVAGNPKAMRLPNDAASKRRPIITLIVNLSANCGTQTDAMNNRAASVAAIIDQIEVAGFCVEVIAIGTSHEGYVRKGSPDEIKKRGFAAGTAVVIKPSDQPTDIGRLAFGLGHASMLRRLVFADWGTEESCKKTIGSHLGYPFTFTADEEQNWKGIFVLPSVSEKSELFKDEKFASTVGVEYLINELKKQKCPAFP